MLLHSIQKDVNLNTLFTNAEIYGDNQTFSLVPEENEPFTQEWEEYCESLSNIEPSEYLSDHYG